MGLAVPGLLENGRIALADGQLIRKIPGEHICELVVVVVDENRPLVLVAGGAEQAAAGQQQDASDRKGGPAHDATVSERHAAR